MSQTLAADARPVALEVHALIREMDPSRWRDDVENRLRARCVGLGHRLQQLIGREPEAGFSECLGELRVVLAEHVPEADLPVDERRSAWSGYRKRLQEAYESLSESMREESMPIPAVRPTNYVRSTWHVLVSVLLVVLVEEVLSRRALWLVPLCFATTFWAMEGMRQYSETARRFLLWVFKSIAHPHERYRVNSSTWFATALVILGALFEPMLCSVGLICLGVGDPAAGLVGRRFGKTKLVGQRSLEGSLAMLFVAGFATCSVLMVWHTALPIGTMLAVSASAALFGTVAELSSSKIDDNFSIPLAAASGGWLALQAATVIGTAS
jgi:dolichol kinase